MDVTKIPKEILEKKGMLQVQLELINSQLQAVNQQIVDIINHQSEIDGKKEK